MIYRFNFNPYDIVFDKIMEAEKAKFDSSTTIIYIGLGYDILSFINKFKNYKKIWIINNEISKNINIKDNNLDIINVPYQIEDLIDMANDIKSEIKDSYLINLFDNKNGISAFYKYANKIIDKKSLAEGYFRRPKMSLQVLLESDNNTIEDKTGFKRVKYNEFNEAITKHSIE